MIRYIVNERAPITESERGAPECLTKGQPAWLGLYTISSAKPQIPHKITENCFRNGANSVGYSPSTTTEVGPPFTQAVIRPEDCSDGARPLNGGKKRINSRSLPTAFRAISRNPAVLFIGAMTFGNTVFSHNPVESLRVLWSEGKVRDALYRLYKPLGFQAGSKIDWPFSGQGLAHPDTT